MRRTLPAFALATTCALLSACGGSFVDEATSQAATAGTATADADASDPVEPSASESPSTTSPKSTGPFGDVDPSDLKSTAAINWPQSVDKYSHFTDVPMPMFDAVYAPPNHKSVADMITVTVWNTDVANDPTFESFFGNLSEPQANVACQPSSLIANTADCAVLMSDGWLQVMSFPYSGDLEYPYTWTAQLYDAM